MAQQRQLGANNTHKVDETTASFFASWLKFLYTAALPPPLSLLASKPSSSFDQVALAIACRERGLVLAQAEPDNQQWREWLEVNKRENRSGLLLKKMWPLDSHWCVLRFFASSG